MLPPITGSSKPESSTSKLKWQKSTRRISYVKLPAISSSNSASSSKPPKPTKPLEEEPVTSARSPRLPPVPTITPSLCIDNQYFSNYINEKPRMDDVDYLSRAFAAFAKVQGTFHAQRTNYFEKRGLLEAIEINIEQQNNKISEALGCLAVCNEITEKYHCTLNISFQTLVDDFAQKAFNLTSLNSQLHTLEQTRTANLEVRKNEENQLEEIEWRIEREERRIRKLDEKLWRFYENRNKLAGEKGKQ